MTGRPSGELNPPDNDRKKSHFFFRYDVITLFRHNEKKFRRHQLPVKPMPAETV